MEQLLDEPDANYWYAFGRIAEQYGENEVAAADYKQVKKPGKACGWRGALTGWRRFAWRRCGPGMRR